MKIKPLVRTALPGLALQLLLCSLAHGADLPAFPGAEGFGAGSRGGRGGKVFVVRTLEDYKRGGKQVIAGSLREACEAEGPRIIVFDVAGTIELKSALVLSKPFVTIAGQTFDLTRPFLVLGTQNPIEQEGTYPLPEAQLDRFMFKVVVGGLNREELNEVVSRTILRKSIDLPVVLDGPGILGIRETLDKVVVADPLRDYAVRLVLATHPDNDEAPDGIRQFVRWGASPRAAQALIRAARVRALGEGRAHIAFEDISEFATEVLQHRVLLNYDGQAENVDVAALIADCIASLDTTD